MSAPVTETGGKLTEKYGNYIKIEEDIEATFYKVSLLLFVSIVADPPSGMSIRRRQGRIRSAQSFPFFLCYIYRMIDDILLFAENVNLCGPELSAGVDITHSTS